MNITLEIATYNLGSNTSEDNEAYRLAIDTQLQRDYPEAEIDVSLCNSSIKDVVHVGGAGHNNSIEESVLLLVQQFWHDAEY